MSKTTRAKQAFIADLKELFGPEHWDRWGNVKFEKGGRQLRIKLNKNSWRYEGKVVDRWNKIIGAYYTDPKSAVALRMVQRAYKGD